MAKEVDLLSYWMSLLRNLKEFKEIANTEEPELRYILEAIDRTLNNMFIETADEYGIERLESMMGIIPDEGADLETRRFKVLTLWNDYIPFTKSELWKRLVSICGAGNFELNERYQDYIVELYTHLGAVGAFDMVLETLEEMLPCNLEVVYENKVPVKAPICYSFGGIGCTTEKVRVDYAVSFSEKSPLTLCSGLAVRVIEQIKV